VTSPNTPLTVGEIARTLGWSTDRARTWLDGLAERDPSIIVRVRGRRQTTLASLRRVCPDVAKKFASDLDVDEIREEQGMLSEEIRRVAKELGEFRRKSHAWLTRVEAKIDRLASK
jgi:hypothetical protein